MVQMKLMERWRDAFNLIVANSEAVKGSLMAEGIGPVEVVWNGVPVRPARPPLSDPPTIVFAGRLVREKGVDVLVRAFSTVVRELPEARLLLAGDGPERDRIRALIDAGLSANVTVLGQTPHGELERISEKAWVQVVPSLFDEPFGIVATESMMRGTAVVASRSGGLAEIVGDGQTGLLVPPGDPAALAGALIELLSNRPLAEAMGREGREVVLKHFTEDRFVDEFEQLYRRLA
jgi:glycosyltransferase involved in cell wall biosynthesis